MIHCSCQNLCCADLRAAYQTVMPDPRQLENEAVLRQLFIAAIRIKSYQNISQEEAERRIDSCCGSCFWTSFAKSMRYALNKQSAAPD